MSEDIASRDYEAEIYLLKAEIKRLGEFEDYYIRTHKHVYVAAIVQPYEEKIKRLEAEVERLKKYKMFFESCSCFFAEGTEFMTKAEIYEAIKKETKNLK
jgi:hypothetical protein